MEASSKAAALLPSVFIGSSSEGVQICQYLQVALQETGCCLPTIWTQGVFHASGYTMESLADTARKSDFAVLVATPDDTVASRGSTSPIVRDNVIFELGLFIGALGRERTYIVADNAEGLRLPSDMNGLTWLPYHRRPDGNYRAAVAEAALGITERIRDLGPRPISSVQETAPVPGDSAARQARALTAEINRICSDARAQGWRIKTNSDTTLRLQGPRGQRYTFSIGAPGSSRARLRQFAAQLRAGGLRVNQSVRRSVEDAPEIVS